MFWTLSFQVYVMQRLSHSGTPFSSRYVPVGEGSACAHRACMFMVISYARYIGKCMIDQRYTVCALAHNLVIHVRVEYTRKCIIKHRTSTVHIWFRLRNVECIG